MPRYFFNVRKGQPIFDDLGDELADDAIAWKEATKIAGELLRSLDGSFQPGQERAVEVADSHQQTLFWIGSSRRRRNETGGITYERVDTPVSLRLADRPRHPLMQKSRKEF